jgi:hypothetical protein
MGNPVIHKGGSGMGYVLMGSHASFSYLDATTYYFGQPFTADPTTTAQNRKIFIPKAGVIKRIDVIAFLTGTLGTTETSTMSIRLNDTTDTTIVTTINLSTAFSSYVNSALNIAVAAGDYVEFKFVTPTWVTNPVGTRITGQIYIE